MAGLNIKKGDTVLVLTGKEVGRTGEVLECFPRENKATVKGINIVVKHKKPRSAQDKGGIVKKEGKIDASNLMVVCPSCNKATRVGSHIDEKGKKHRVCKKCGASLDTGKKNVKAQPKKEGKVEEKEKQEVKEVKEEKVVSKKKTTTKKPETSKETSTKTTKKSTTTAKKVGGKDGK